MNPKRLLTIILCLTLIAVIIDMPAEIPVNLNYGPIKINTIIRRPYFDFNLFGNRITSNFEIKKGLDLQGGTHVVLQADMKDIKAEDRQTALESAKNVISRRVDLFGVAEPLIQTSVANDDYRIVVELPGAKDINQTLDLIGKTAQLDFRELSPEATQAAFLSDFIPTSLTGKHLKKASVQFDQSGQPEVSIQFNDEGTSLFSDITGRNIDKPVAIFLDELPVTIPKVNQHITGGEAVISGGFTLEEAKNLSIQLNAGALPVPINIIEQRNIGASLGQDSVNKSLQAGLIGLGMVMLFMVLLYGFQGFLANIALAIYGLLTLALYKLIPVTLTLPGLAGFILSVGMAVDSNILIFERMKEELRMGKPWRTAMELGFGRAWDSIKDANMATLMTAFILFNPLDWSFLNSSGMVRGFALTLGLGVITSLFTGIVVTRTLMRLFYRQKDQPKLIQGKSFSAPTNFMKMPVIYFIVSLIVLIPGTYSLAKYGLRPAIDFTGGSLVELKFEDLTKVNEDDVRNIIPEGIDVVSVQKTDSGSLIFRTKPITKDQNETIKQELSKQYGGLEELRFESIGPVLGQELLKKTITAIVVAAGLILVYIAYRFKNMKFGISAVLAMFHDSLVILSVFSLLGHFAGVEVDTLFVTALLTILSFSVHDTIVVYDRIRESLKAHPKAKFVDLVNKAVNETLARSINNSMTIIFMLTALYLMGGETTKWFVFALLVGTLTGTYSSTFTAAPLLVIWDRLQRKK